MSLKKDLKRLTALFSIHPTITEDLTKSELRIFEQMAFWSDGADQEGRSYITPGYEKIAKKCHCSEKTVQRATDKFDALGLIEKLRRNPLGWGQWRTNLYRVNQAIREWAQKFYHSYRRTFLSNKHSKNINYQSEEGKNAPPGDSLPPAGRLTQLSLAAIHAKATA